MQVGLKARIHGHVHRVASEERELNVHLPRRGQECRIERIALGFDDAWVRHAERVLHLGADEGGKFAQSLLGGGVAGVCIVVRQGRKGRSFDVGVPVLGDYRPHGGRIVKGKTETDRGTVVEDTDDVGLYGKLGKEGGCCSGESVESVGVVARGGHGGEAEAWKVWGEEMVLGC